jgi:hypothetical protein
VALLVLLAVGGCPRSSAPAPAPAPVGVVAPEPEPEPTPAPPSGKLGRDEQTAYERLLPRDPEPECPAVEAGLASPTATLLAIAETVESPPWVGMRAAGCLVEHAADPTVEAALIRWVSEEQLAGLGLLAVNLLDQMPEEVAMRVANAALEGPISDRARDEIAGSAHQSVRELQPP